MATLISPSPTAAEAEALYPLWRLSVEQYHAMIEAGILTADSPVELLEGVLLEKMSKKPPHSFATEEIRAALSAILRGDWFVRAQEPITLADSEPEPDVVVARGSNRAYQSRHPGVADVAMVVEVSDSTLARDRGVKLRVYARAGIPVFWIVDLTGRRVEIFTEPLGDGYRTSSVIAEGGELPVVVDGVVAGTIPVDSILP